MTKKGSLESEFEILNTIALEARKKSSIKWYQGILALAGGHKFYKDDSVASVVRRGHKPYIGGIFQYGYDPKTKEKLKYYDRFPIVIPIEFYNNGFLGLNLHYMPPKMRVKILDKLMSYEKTIRTGTNGKRVYMALSYQMLKGLYHIPGFDFMLKRYLYTNIKTRIMRISSENWREVVYLPTQQFVKASDEKVWTDAMAHIRKVKRERTRGKK